MQAILRARLERHINRRWIEIPRERRYFRASFVAPIAWPSTTGCASSMRTTFPPTIFSLLRTSRSFSSDWQPVRCGYLAALRFFKAELTPNGPSCRPREWQASTVIIYRLFSISPRCALSTSAGLRCQMARGIMTGYSGKGSPRRMRR